MKKKKILIVDDDVGLTYLLREYLQRKSDFEVLEENDSRHVVDTAKQVMPDLILLDVIMPHVDGGEVAARLSANAATNRIAIVFLTGVVQRSEVDDHGGMIGGYPFISKPIDFDSFLPSLENVLACSYTGEPVQVAL